MIDVVTLYTVETGLVTRRVTSAVYQAPVIGLIGRTDTSVTTSVSLICVSALRVTHVRGRAHHTYAISSGLRCLETSSSLLCISQYPNVSSWSIVDDSFRETQASCCQVYAISTFATCVRPSIFVCSELTDGTMLDSLNARKSLRRRTHQGDQHILPMISSLHEAQSETHGEDVCPASSLQQSERFVLQCS